MNLSLIEDCPIPGPAVEKLVMPVSSGLLRADTGLAMVVNLGPMMVVILGLVTTASDHVIEMNSGHAMEMNSSHAKAVTLGHVKVVTLGHAKAVILGHVTVEIAGVAVAVQTGMENVRTLIEDQFLVVTNLTDMMMILIVEIGLTHIRGVVTFLMIVDLEITIIEDRACMHQVQTPNGAPVGDPLFFNPKSKLLRTHYPCYSTSR